MWMNHDTDVAFHVVENRSARQVGRGVCPSTSRWTRRTAPSATRRCGAWPGTSEGRVESGQGGRASRAGRCPACAVDLPPVASQRRDHPVLAAGEHLHPEIRHGGLLALRGLALLLYRRLHGVVADPVLGGVGPEGDRVGVLQVRGEDGRRILAGITMRIGFSSGWWAKNATGWRRSRTSRPSSPGPRPPGR